MTGAFDKKSGYRAEIDGLRAFAVLSVVAFHALPDLFPGGFIGVDVFFVISGFLISAHIFEKLGEKTFSFSDFFKRRIRRIFPALIVVMASTLMFGKLVLLSDEYKELGLHAASAAAFVINFLLASEVGYFDSAAELKPMLHLWSLSVEEQFYIIWPLLLWIAWKCKSNLLIIAVSILVLSFVYSLNSISTKPVETFFWPFSRFWELLAGSVLAWFYTRSTAVKSYSVSTSETVPEPSFIVIRHFFSSALAINVLSLVGLLLLVVSVTEFSAELPFPSAWTLMPVIGAVLIIYSGAAAWLNRFFLMNRFAVWIGLISYPLYLWHWPILSYLHIIEDGTPHRDKRIGAIIIAILFAWLTYKFIEKPIRYSSRQNLSSLILLLLMMTLGGVGYLVSIGDFSKSNTAESVLLRKGLEHKIGSSNRWYKGKSDWLYLGNSYDRTVEKLKLSSTPTPPDIANLELAFANLSEVAKREKTQIALLIGPNKSTIYPEYLPDALIPSEKRYFSFFHEALQNVPDLTVYDPTIDLLNAKADEGYLYYRTDTHWNSKGAFLSFSGLSMKLGLPVPDIEFSLGSQFIGGLIESSEIHGERKNNDLEEISGLNDFTIHNDDNWEFKINGDYQLDRNTIKDLPLSDAFGTSQLVLNSNPLSKKRVWVVGDSFTEALKPFIDASFEEVSYLGHWSSLLESLPARLESAPEKPDLIIIVRVERSF